MPSVSKSSSAACPGLWAIEILTSLVQSPSSRVPSVYGFPRSAFAEEGDDVRHAGVEANVGQRDRPRPGGQGKPNSCSRSAASRRGQAERKTRGLTVNFFMTVAQGC